MSKGGLRFKNGWRIRKPSLKDYEFQNSWTELVLEEDKEGLRLHGLVAYHSNNVKLIKQIFDSLHCTYKLEYYDENRQIVENMQNDL